jgi:hypothetical protein
LYRSPTQASSLPLRGWNGCVMRTRRTPTLETPAFEVEVQASGARPFPLAKSGRGSGVVEPGSALDAAGRHRLAKTGENQRAIHCCLEHLFTKMFAYLHAIEKLA